MAKNNGDPIEYIRIKSGISHGLFKTRGLGWWADCGTMEGVERLRRERKACRKRYPILLAIGLALAVISVLIYIECLAFPEMMIVFCLQTAVTCAVLLAAFLNYRTMRRDDRLIHEYESTQPKSKKNKRK